MIKLVVIDLDGSLLDSNCAIPKDFEKVFKALKEHRIEVALISGRPLPTIKTDFPNIFNDAIIITDSGALISDHGSTIYKNYLDTTALLEIWNIYEGLSNTFIVLCGEDCAYLNSTDERFINEVNKYFYKTETFSSINEIKSNILKVSICNFNDISKIDEEHFSLNLSNKLNISLSGEFWLDITNKNVNKGFALKRIQDRHVIIQGETMCFGDYYTDIPMFQNSYYSYAMKNAPLAVKNKARFVIASNDENAVIDTIKKSFPDIFKH